VKKMRPGDVEQRALVLRFTCISFFWTIFCRNNA